MSQVGRSDVIPAIRGWGVRWPPSRRARLQSLIVPFPWRGPVERTGRPVRHPPAWPPVEARPEVGFYACVPEHAYEALHRYTGLECVGTVSLFGRVVEHERGYRAEVVRLDHLCLVKALLGGTREAAASEIVHSLGREYRCSVSLVPTLENAVRTCRRRLQARSGA